MRRLVVVLAWLSVSATIIAFFLPWASIDLREPELIHQVRETAQEQGLLGGLAKKLGRVTVEIRRGAETITGDLPTLSDIPRQVSGVQIPRMANQPNAKVALALIERLTNQHQHVGFKSYAVYLVPGIALLCGVLLTCLGSVVAVAGGIAIICLGIAGVGFWNLLTTNTETLFVAITIGPGLWISLWAYVGLALAAGLSINFASRNSSRPGKLVPDAAKPN